MNTILICATILKIVSCYDGDAAIRADAIVSVRGQWDRYQIEIKGGENICIYKKDVAAFVESWDAALVECQKNK